MPRDFEEFLMEYHAEHNPTILDDDLIDAFDNWIANLDSEEWIMLGDKYAETIIRSK